MRAVNLIPAGERRGGGGRAGGRSGGGAYVVLAVLAVLVAVLGAYTMAGKQISEREAELAQVEGAAAAVEARAAALAPYTQFAELSRSRLETITQLADSRFDWSHALRELARVVPGDVDLLSVTGTVAPGVGVEGSSGSGLRAALPVPALEMVGCARSQSEVARLLARLRAVDGVQRVTLSSSEKADAGGGGEAECRTTAGRPQFSVIVFFEALAGAVPSAPGTPPAEGAAPPTGEQPAPQGDTAAPAPVPTAETGAQP